MSLGESRPAVNHPRMTRHRPSAARPPKVSVPPTPLEKFKARLREMGHEITEYDGGFASQCTAHPDRNPSMTFREGDDGRLLAFCHRCGDGAFADIVRGAGLELDDVSPKDWEDLATRYEINLLKQPARLRQLAEGLGVPEASLRALGVGLRRDQVRDGDTWVAGDECYTFPESNGRGDVVGILRRYLDRQRDKKAVQGSKRGLCIPSGFKEMTGPVHVVEGPTDVAALISVGRTAVGRPSAKGGVEHLAELLRDDPREIIIVGENDRKADGSWPGREGAESVARQLARRLDREVKVALPPEPHKDLRALLNATREGAPDVRN